MAKKDKKMSGSGLLSLAERALKKCTVKKAKDEESFESNDEEFGDIFTEDDFNNDFLSDDKISDDFSDLEVSGDKFDVNFDDNFNNDLDNNFDNNFDDEKLFDGFEESDGSNCEVDDFSSGGDNDFAEGEVMGEGDGDSVGENDKESTCEDFMGGDLEFPGFDDEEIDDHLFGDRLFDEECFNDDLEVKEEDGQCGLSDEEFIDFHNRIEKFIDKICEDKKKFLEIIFNKIFSENEEEFITEMVEKHAELTETRNAVIKAFAKNLDYYLEDFYKDFMGNDECISKNLRSFGASCRSDILSELKKEVPELHDVVTVSVINFEDVLKTDDRGVQVILRDVDGQTLAKALKIASNDIKEKFYRNMSKRAAAMLQEDIEFMGRVTKSDCINAQEIITKIMARLEDSGYITILRDNDSFV